MLLYFYLINYWLIAFHEINTLDATNSANIAPASGVDAKAYNEFLWQLLH